ncbi:MAG TPA: hypothetical protein VKB14_11970, partial [Actinomycetales bacterium]|nr:hypothetical protein [Actinomycetales bacterium]
MSALLRTRDAARVGLIVAAPDRLFEPALRDRNGALIHVTVKTRRLIYGNIDLGAYPKGNAARTQSA